MSFPQMPEWLKPAELKAIEARINTIERDVKSNTDGLKSANTNISQIKNNVDSITSRAQSLQKTVDGVKSDVDAAKKNITTITKTANDAATDIKNIKDPKWFNDKFGSAFSSAFSKDFPGAFDKRFPTDFKNSFPDAFKGAFPDAFKGAFPDAFKGAFPNAFDTSIGKFKLPDLTANLKSIGTFTGSQTDFDKVLKTIRDNLDKEVKGLNSTLVGKDSALGKWTTGVGGMKTDIAARMKVLKTTTDKLNAIPVKWAARMTSLQKNLDSNAKDFENDMYKKSYSKTYKYTGYGDLTISGNGLTGYVADMLKHIDAALGMPTNRAEQIRGDISWGIETLSTYPAAYAEGIAKMVKSTLNDIGNDIKSLMDELTQSIKDTLKGTPMENLPDLPKSPSDVMPKLDEPPALTPPSAPSLKALP